MTKVLSLLALASAALALPSARADVFNITFSGGVLGYSGSGTFLATSLGGGEYLVTGVYPGGMVTDPGFGKSGLVSISNYDGADNLLSYPNAGNYFDLNGLGLSLANGVSIDLYNYTAGATLFQAALESSPSGDIPELVTEAVIPTTAPTPEPGTFVLLGTSALAGAGILRRRLI